MFASLVVLWILALVDAQSLPSDFLGLARDFQYDLTVANHDRLVFSAKASGVHSFTFYSEGDLSDNLAFYLYGTWIWDYISPPTAKSAGQSSWNSTDARFFLVKTRSKLPVERYDVTEILVDVELTHPQQNIMNNLERLCESLFQFGAILKQEWAAESQKEHYIHANVNALLPDTPTLFRGIFAKSIANFESTIDSEMGTVVSAIKSRRLGRLTPPEDFNYTWQVGENEQDTETLTLNYDRGFFKVIVDSVYPDFKTLIEALD